MELDLGTISMVDFPLPYQLGLLHAMRCIVTPNSSGSSGSSGGGVSNGNSTVNSGDNDTAASDSTQSPSQSPSDTPILYEIIECAKEWIECPVEWVSSSSSSSSARKSKSKCGSSKPGENTNTNTNTTDDTPGSNGDSNGDTSTEDGIELYNIRLATEIAYITAVDPLTLKLESELVVDTTRKGGLWCYTVGLVGKPSAGKSSFYNAITKAAMKGQWSGSNGCAGNGNNSSNSSNSSNGNGNGHSKSKYMAAVSPHPFTTIEPNIGPGWFLGPRDDDGTLSGTNRPGDGTRGTLNGTNRPTRTTKLEELLSGPNNCTNNIKVVTSRSAAYGRDLLTNRRYLPIIVKDVAGLVPGAYKGRGKGNKFLNDLCDADVLIHIVDASGSATVDGCGYDTNTDNNTNTNNSNTNNGSNNSCLIHNTQDRQDTQATQDGEDRQDTEDGFSMPHDDIV